jgi:outer membrane protein OmpA-like peptidoglycan-associated protein
MMKTTFPAILFLMGILNGYGQSALHRKAEKHLHGFEYAAAAETFEKIVEQNPSDIQALKGLAVCYDKLNDPMKAESSLADICNRPDSPKHYYKWYARVLASNGKYSESTRWYKKYVEAVPDVHAIHTIDRYQRMESFFADSSFYDVKWLALNTDQSDFSPAFYEGGLVFCSADRSKNKARHAWDNSRFIDLYWIMDIGSPPTPLGKPVNSALHEGPSTFTAAFDTVYFTRNSPANRDGILRLKIFYSVRQNGVWQKEQGLPLNNDTYSIGHPALAADHRLYFVSDMPGGFGGTDLYYSEFIGGKWSVPFNLGPAINTPGNEMFPFADQEGNLYFASNTHPGLGGLDIFFSKKEHQRFAAPRNLGYPINTSSDDFGLIIRNNEGFFSSNRGINSKDDNIYSLSVNKMKSVFIMPTNKKGKPLEDFDMVVITGGSSDTRHGDKVLPATFNCEEAYSIECSKAGYQKQSITLERASLMKLSDKDTIRIVLAGEEKNVRAELQSAEGKKLAKGTLKVRNTITGETQTFSVDEGRPVGMRVNVQEEYELTGINPDYKTRSVTLDSASLTDLANDAIIPVTLSPADALFEKNEIGQLIELNIRYDVSKSTIRADAARELDKLVTFLKKNKNVKVELGSHTDTRGSEEANHSLSQKRAEAAVRYIVAKGISHTRLIPIGYGESSPKVSNASTEEEHQENRRTTVKIVGI